MVRDDTSVWLRLRGRARFGSPWNSTGYNALAMHCVTAVIQSSVMV